jgi:arabinosaccharide transport system substrate-binding protein
LYLSRDLAHKLYERGDIVTPVSEFWQDDIYDKPDPFFMGQPKGRMYINLAPQVPDRFSSPFGAIALARTQSAVSQLCKVARDTKATNIDQLMPKAREFLAAAQEDAMRHVNRNVFFADSQKAAEVTP